MRAYDGESEWRNISNNSDCRERYIKKAVSEKRTPVVTNERLAIWVKKAVSEGVGGAYKNFYFYKVLGASFIKSKFNFKLTFISFYGLTSNFTMFIKAKFN